jgi:hypothetical protein
MTVTAVFSRLLRETGGVTLPLVAAAITALMGFTGLGVEAGFWYAIKRQNQSAADVAALSGALELYNWQASGLASYPDICGLAYRDAGRNGFAPTGSCPSSSPGLSTPPAGQMYVNNPPVLGTYKNNNSVEVILAQQQSSFFASLFLPNVTINSRAVASILTNRDACLLALAPTITDITEQGNPTITMPNCAVAAASNNPSAVSLGGSSVLDALAVVTPGNCSGCGSVPIVHAPVFDPYASKLTHTFLLRDAEQRHLQLDYPDRKHNHLFWKLDRLRHCRQLRGRQHPLRSNADLQWIKL